MKNNSNSRKTLIIGLGLILLGVMGNPWVVMKVQPVEDYQGTEKEYRALIWMADFLLVIAGILVIACRNKPLLLKKLKLMAVSGAVSLLLFEFACRMYLFGRNSFSFTKVNSVYVAEYSPGNHQLSSYPEITYEFKPNIDYYFQMHRMKTNSRGLCDREFTLAKSSDTFRVAVIGDSFTMGWGVEIDECYPKLLEAWANRDSADKAFEFINFSFPGYSLREYLSVIKNKALAYNPDLILIGICPNDDEITSEEKLRHTPAAKPRSNPFFRFFFLDMIRSSRAYQAWLHRHWANRDAGLDPKVMEHVREMFQQYRLIGLENDIPIVMAYLHMPTLRDKFAVQLAGENDLPFVDTADRFDNSRASDYIVNPIDGHPNNIAHRIYADVIYEFMLKQNLLPATRENFNADR